MRAKTMLTASTMHCSRELRFWLAAVCQAHKVRIAESGIADQDTGNSGRKGRRRGSCDAIR